MATFFSNVQVAYWATSSQPVFGTLSGQVSRSGNAVTISNFTLRLASPTPYSGSKTFNFIVNGISNTIPITVNMSTNLGTFLLSPVTLSVLRTQSYSTIPWFSSSGFSGQFNASYFSYPPDPYLALVSATENELVVEYGASSFGNPNNGTITLYSDNTTPPTTVIDTKSTFGNTSVTLSGLTPNTTYYFIATATNTENYSSTSSNQFSTIKATGIYGSVNGNSKKIIKLYGSVNDETKEIIKLYGSVNGNTKQIF